MVVANSVTQEATTPMLQFSYFQGPITNTRPVAHGPMRLDWLWHLITGKARDGEPNGYARLQQQVEALRAAAPTERNRLKRELDYVTPAGTFAPTRSNVHLQEPSGLLVLDFDHLPDVAATRETLLADALLGPEIALLFTSPTGTGLKAFVRLDPAYSYAENFESIAAYLRSVHPSLQLSLDAKCRDVSRACFLSHDPEAYLHPDYR